MQRLQSERFVPLDVALPWPEDGAGSSRELSSREQQVIEAVQACRPAATDGVNAENIIVDVAKSRGRAPVCRDAAPCCVPNSLPFRLRSGTFLTTLQICTLQGIYEEDFPALGEWVGDGRRARILRDMMGNAFSAPVFLSVVLAVIANSPRPQ